ncbi:hypothetical protein [Streptomyces sp. NPDC058045]|uniref:hypothetical protein n=1 Tax=Streptomyces sp. NPDC058045 TaxID=3346311 RepID=UPI0036EDB6C5
MAASGVWGWAVATGRWVRGTLIEPGSWAPRRPRLAGALTGLTGAGVLIGSGVLIAVGHHLNELVLVGPVLLGVVVLLWLPLILGTDSPGHLMALLLLGIFLLVMVPYGFRSAVLDWRGEHIRSTVVAVERSTSSRTGGDSYTCKLRDAQGRSSTLQADKCGSDSRPGDRYEILRDPGDLVGALSSDPPISFPVLLGSTGGAALLMAAVGAWTMSQSAGTAGGGRGGG